MKTYILYDNQGNILKRGSCPDVDINKQTESGIYIIVNPPSGANDITYKVVDGKVVKKTQAEIEAGKPPEPAPIPFEKQRINITNKQYQDILNRLTKLENE